MEENINYSESEQKAFDAGVSACIEALDEASLVWPEKNKPDAPVIPPYETRSGFMIRFLREKFGLK